jgi:hypothetical protein
MKSKKAKKYVDKVLYFYLDGKLYKTLHRNRAEDLIIVWDYLLEKRVAYSLSDVQKNRTHAYTVTQAAKMINRSVDTIKRHWRDGDIKDLLGLTLLTDKKDQINIFLVKMIFVQCRNFLKQYIGVDQEKMVLLPQAIFQVLQKLKL